MMESSLVMDVQPTFTDPAKLTFESVPTRRYILASYWLVVLLALPLWWTTTSIDRLSLPASQVYAAKRELLFPLNVHVFPNDTRQASFVVELQQQMQAKYKEWESGGMDLHITSEHSPSNGNDTAYQVVLDLGDRDPVINDDRLHFYFPSVTSGSTQLSSKGLSETLSKLLMPYATQSYVMKHAQREVKYAPRYRLAFTLLNQDAASGNSALSWDVQDAISAHISPDLDRLSVLHNFTLESQVQYHAPLAFQPKPLALEGTIVHGLKPEDLTVFINSAEWTLSSSVSNDPVLHFVLFIPSADNSPLRILEHDESIALSNAFILPQWGGIVLMNLPPSKRSGAHLSTEDLDNSFRIFRHQLHTLLGIPELPARVLSNKPDTFTNWQLDALVRRRVWENVKGTQETLFSIVKLVDQIENMPVGQDVKGDVQNALKALEQAYSATSTSLTLALRHSAESSALASRAFFNPGMLALLYFPAEHKYAVYTPLFASVAAPLVAAVVREFLSWRQARRSGAIDNLVRLKVE